MNSGSRAMAMGLVVSWCLFVWLWAAPANGHVLEGPHVLDLMVRKLAGAQTLRVDQLVTVEDSAIASQPIDLEESLSFIFPDRFRSDIKHENTHRIHVLSHGQVMTVVDGTISSGANPGRFDRYKDLFLYNSRFLLHKMLSEHGVDVGITSLGRMEDHVVFVIGANYPDDSVSQVWVDKERFVPLRWINIFKSEQTGMESERLEFIYRNWQKVDGVLYPLQITTFHNQHPIRQVRVTKVRANTVIPVELLDIPHLMTLYPREDEALPDDQEPNSDVDEVERTIEDFRKKFDP
jgi:outer membrane lipoprotein-sorting protein